MPAYAEYHRLKAESRCTDCRQPSFGGTVRCRQCLDMRYAERRGKPRNRGRG